MATKTISVDLEAYEKLRRARRVPDESFSNVIRRARWPEDAYTAASFLARCTDAPVIDDTTLERLEKAQHADAAPENPWRSG